MPVTIPRTTTDYASYVPSAQWGALAYDLLLDNASTGDVGILECYDITQHQLEELTENPRFQAVLLEVKQELDKLGDNAKFISRAKAITENVLPELLNRATDPRTETKDVLAIFKTLSSLAGLDPATNGTKNKTEEAPDLGRGGSFTLVLHGIPGMEHLQAPAIIAAAAKSTHDIIDAVDLRDPALTSDVDEL